MDKLNNQESKDEVVDETTKPEAPQEEKNTDNSKLEAPEGDELKQEELLEEKNQAVPSEPDYRAELEKAKSSLEKAEHTIVKLKKNKNQDQPEINLDEIKDELRAEVTTQLEQNVSRVLSAQLEEFRLEDRRNYIDDRIKELTPNSDKRELIRFLYDKRVVKSGLTKEAINDDLSLAESMADKSVSKKVEIENRELKESLVSKQSISNTGYGHSVKDTKTEKGKTTVKDIEIANKYFRGDIERYMKYKSAGEQIIINK